MRLTTAAILAATTLIVAGGIYQYLVVTQPSEPAASVSKSPATTASAGRDSSFVLHETPQPVPELSFVDGEGRERSLADFRGKTILLNIWATWCVPCRKEMPALDRLQAKLGDANFDVVPLSIDRDRLPKVNAFYEELGLGALGIYVDASGKAAYRLGAVGIPTTLLINSDGLETGRLMGPAEWDSPELVDIIEQKLAKPARKRTELPVEHRNPA